MLLKISFLNHFKALSHELIGIGLMLIALFIIGFENSFILSFGLWFIALSLPTIYLHFEYYFINKGEEIILENNCIRIKSNLKGVKEYRFDELESVVYYKSASLDKGGMPLMPCESYHYIKINTKSKKQIIITCLMYPKLDEVVSKIKEIPLTRKKFLICSLLRL